MAKESAAHREKREAKEAKKLKSTQDDVMQELFYDMYRHRNDIYRINFLRGIFFGLGSVIGGTVVVAIVIWILTQFVDIPHIGEFFERLLRVLEQAPPAN